MKVARLRFFPIVLGILFFAACGHKGGSTEDNLPIFQSPELKGITDKIHNNPKDATLYFDRGKMLHKMELDTLAIKDFEKAATLDSTKSEYFSAVGDLMFEHKDISGSVKWIQKAIKLNPDDTKAHLKIAKMFLYTRDYGKAFAEINLAMRKDVYNPEGYFLKGMLYKDMKDTARSLSSFLTAVQVAPDYKDAIIQLGQLYSDKKDTIALLYYNNAFKLDTNDVFPLFARGVFFQNMGDMKRAKEEYRNCIIHDNQYESAYFNRAYILLQEDSIEKAQLQYDIVTKISPDNPAGYYNRGLCREKLGKNEEAVADYKQALVFDTGYVEAKEGVARLKAFDKPKDE